MNKRTVAIVLAAGSGKRMQSSTPKQYLLLDGKPIIYYSLKAFEESSVDEIILVVSKNDVEYCHKAIVEKYQFKKVHHIIEGGSERYHSVYQGLNTISDADYVLIHDGARPFVTVKMIERTIEEVLLHNACIVGVPSKDTIKIVDEEGIVIETPNRDYVWSIQTPQAFSFDLVVEAYKRILDDMPLNITDDAMIVEHALKYPIKLVMGSYSNIKITTPEDILISESLLKDIDSL